MIRKAIRIRTLRHPGTDLLTAVSDDLPGLVVHGYSDAELERKIPIVIRNLLEAEGFDVIELTVGPDADNSVREFGPPAFIANASLTGSRESRGLLATN
jgi:hypothetical protein